MTHVRRPLAALFLLVAAPAALADDVVLKNGGKLEGKARKDGDTVVVDTGAGEVRLRGDEVASITPAPTRLDLYRERAAAARKDDASAQVELATWCRDKGLLDLEKKHLRAAIALDADHAEARKRLGYLRYDGRWLTEDEYRRARGLVKVGNEWLTSAEVREREASKTWAKSRRDHSKRIEAAVAKMASPKRKTRLEGKVGLQQYAESIGDANLAQYATDVAAYYNAAWGAVLEQYRATATIEVRATMTNLKRPIPTLTTSLGANTTPVTIQLPELSVVSVRTTARVPLGIELDE